MVSSWNGTSLQLVVVLMLVTAFGSAAATASIVGTADPSPIAAAQGSVTASENLSVSSQQLEYDGLDVTNATVTVSNAGNAKQNGTVYFAMKDDTGTVLHRATVDATFSANGDTKVLVDFGGQSYSVANVATVEVTVVETE